MTKESKNLHPEQSTISKLHQSLKVEEPSAQIDKTILTKAKLQLESQIPKVDVHGASGNGRFQLPLRPYSSA
jgi:hypothetical protein